MPTEQDLKALCELLFNCDVKVESAPDKHRLYWLNGIGWIVSDGCKLTPFDELKEAIVAFTKLIYT